MNIGSDGSHSLNTYLLFKILKAELRGRTEEPVPARGNVNKKNATLFSTEFMGSLFVKTYVHHLK